MGPWFGGHGYGGGSQGGFWYHGGGGSGITMGQSTHMVPMDSISASRV
jgi:hypothetical protein